jgi:serine/threonine protein kinase
MNEASNRSAASLPLSGELRVDRLCRRFEEAWIAGERPSLEDYLAQAEGSERKALLRELLHLEVEYRRRAGQAPTQAEYRSRFPDATDLIDGCLGMSRTVDHGAASESTGPHPPLPAGGPTPQLPGYEILGELGRGGMGVVYKARQTSLNRLVALKMVLPGAFTSATAAQRFRQEAQSAGGLDHPGIVPIHEVGEHQGHHYYTMAFIDGPSLTGWVRSRGVPPLAEALRIARGAAEAVEHAHRRGILHRDLKPDNILLDADGRVRITDFGLSKQLGDGRPELTHSGQILGTPHYMAPEQALGKQQALGPPTDVYALGGVLYFLLTGRAPFSADSMAEMLCKVVHDVPESPSASAAIPTAVEAVCLRCLEKDPARRYATAADLARALAELETAPAGDGPVGAARPVSDNLPAPSRPPSAPVMTPLPVAAPSAPGRGRGLWVAAALVLVLGGAGVVTYVLLPRPKGVHAAADGEPAAPPPPQVAAAFAAGPLRHDFPLKASLLGGRTDKEGVVRIKEGDGVRVQVELGRDANVYLWTVGADGTAVQLFPHQGERETLCKKDVPRALPGEGFELGARPGGREQIRVVASTQPLPALPGQNQSGFLVIAEPQHKEAMGKALRDLFIRPVVAVAEVAIPYEVAPAR